ncbi:MAG TPA: PVC-type heme-binding CxxCH protein [Verrucomicrobiales bacterium]|nr:PVC-type heme-binding CxxCH protein [Verrucomicrobiales bacterium]
MLRSLVFLFAAVPLVAEISTPAVLDAELKMELIASEPEINTPVGMAVDKKGRLFVVENNTHQVQPGYKGPKSDRIRIFEDADKDGKFEKVTTFAEGFRNAMCLQFDPDGVLHLTKRDALLKLEDMNGDGVSDKETTLLHWETKGDYPHNGLSGMVFAPDGWLYVGSGENLSLPYTAIGVDGKKIEYLPGGANVFRMKRDGSNLEIVATGLWNGFGVETDGAGRIFAVDNDPDSCPPNRLLHIVPGGDYGFNMMYGRTGLHPFQCWNGEMPGTVPMVCGVGEAAVGIIDMRRTAFRRAGLNIMVGSWGDNQIEAYKLVSKGASVALGERSVLVRGDAGFRPSCMAVAPDESVYICDWADREYSVHGKGRIWRLSAKGPSKVKEEEAVLALSAEEVKAKQLTLTWQSNPVRTYSNAETLTGLTDKDPFVRAAHLWNEAGYMRSKEHLVATYGVMPGKSPVTTASDFDRQLTAAKDAPVSALVLAAARWASLGLTEDTLRTLLQSESAEVVRMAMILASERRIKALKPDIEAAIKKHSAEREVFRTGIAAVELIDTDVSARPAGSNDRLLMTIITNTTQPGAIRALAIRYLGDRNRVSKALAGLLGDKDSMVAAAAAQALGAVPKPEIVAPLRDLALNREAPLAARLDALAALSGKPDGELLALLPLLNAEAPEVVRQAVRMLRGSIINAEIKTALEKAFESVKDSGAKSMLALALGKPPVEIRPGTDEQWHEAVRTGGGNVDEGRRVFFSSAALCSTCHVIEGRGAVVGPNLSSIARSADREKLVDSILIPSREIGPLYVMKTATLKDGRVISGIQSDKETGGRVDLIQPGGTVQMAQKNEVQKIDVAPTSLMPEALELNLTVQEMRDLIAYLQTMK